MSDVSQRLRRLIESHYPETGSASEVIRMVGEASDTERIQAAIVFAASGNLAELRRQTHLTGVDWRDILVNGGLEHEDWREILDQRLG